jgi:hypothetical protein
MYLKARSRESFHPSTLEAPMDSFWTLQCFTRACATWFRELAARGAGPILALAALTMLGAPTAAQQATPPDTGSGATEVSYLFVQTFSHGTWQASDEKEGVHVLTLHGVGAESIYFSDRPAREAGLIPTSELLSSLGFTRDNAPNAVLAATTETGDAEALVIELFAPVYDESSGTLAYEAILLSAYDEAAIGELAQRAADEHLPATFGGGHLFIDSCSVRSNCLV